MCLSVYVKVKMAKQNLINWDYGDILLILFVDYCVCVCNAFDWIPASTCFRYSFMFVENRLVEVSIDPSCFNLYSTFFVISLLTHPPIRTSSLIVLLEHLMRIFYTYIICVYINNNLSIFFPTSSSSFVFGWNSLLLSLVCVCVCCRILIQIKIYKQLLR